MINEIKKQFEALSSLEDKIDFTNQLKKLLHELSPQQKEPVDCVQWVKASQLQSNAYNPNVVASVEMDLLYTSIFNDGYTQPIVVYKLDTPEGEPTKYEIIDGFHRSRIGKERKDINARIHDYLPVVVLDKPIDERIGSTIRHNRARGSHQIKSMSDIVIDLLNAGWDDEKICEKLGMDLEEVFRLKQVSGLKTAFANHVFSKSWEEFEEKNFPDEVGNVGKTIANRPKKEK